MPVRQSLRGKRRREKILRLSAVGDAGVAALEAARPRRDGEAQPREIRQLAMDMRRRERLAIRPDAQPGGLGNLRGVYLDFVRNTGAVGGIPFKRECERQNKRYRTHLKTTLPIAQKPSMTSLAPPPASGSTDARRQERSNE